MREAVLVDLVHGCPQCGGSALLEEAASDRHVFLLCVKRHREENVLSGACLSAFRSVRVLDSDTTAECLYRLKQDLDQLDTSCIRVFTSPQGRQALIRYQEQLFTAVYTFDYTVTSDPTCPGCSGTAHTGPTAERVQEEVSTFVQQLPALMGDITVLKSTLIPETFGHGFSSRHGGVSCVPTQSAMNLFCSQSRRDPPAVVLENRRRLALHAGFPPQSFHLVKVTHASAVWVLGKDEPQRYDAVVTNRRGEVLVAPGADCMPILFADPVSKVIGAAHAGWKGTLEGVAMATVDAMVREFGCHVSDILVAVGPSVGVCCFTLEPDQALDFTRIHTGCVPDPESARPHVNIRLASRVASCLSTSTTTSRRSAQGSRPAPAATRRRSSPTSETGPRSAPRWASCGSEGRCDGSPGRPITDRLQLLFGAFRGIQEIWPLRPVELLTNMFCFKSLCSSVLIHF